MNPGTAGRGEGAMPTTRADARLLAAQGLAPDSIDVVYGAALSPVHPEVLSSLGLPLRFSSGSGQATLSGIS